MVGCEVGLWFFFVDSFEKSGDAQQHSDGENLERPGKEKVKKGSRFVRKSLRPEMYK